MTLSAVRIGIAGTHSTGKSSFLDELHSSLGNFGYKVGVVSNLAVAARDAGFPILAQQTVDTAMWIVAEGIRRESEAAICHDVVLVDRAVFDAVGYLDAALELSEASCDPRKREALVAISRAYSMTYDELVATELDAQQPLGPGRDANNDFRDLAGKKILEQAKALGVPFRVLRSDNRQVVSAAILKRLTISSRA